MLTRSADNGPVTVGFRGQTPPGRRATMAAMSACGQVDCHAAGGLVRGELLPCRLAAAGPPCDPASRTAAAPVWSSCATGPRRRPGIPTAQCGTVAVPGRTTRNPMGAQAQLAVIRVPATGPRIGVLSSTPAVRAPRLSTPSPRWAPRWPAPRSGSASTWSARPARRRALDAATALPHRRRVRRLPCASRWPTTARPGSPTSKRSTAQFAAQCLDRMGADFLANVGTASRGARHGRGAGGAGREPDQLSRLLLRHRTRRRLRRAVTPTGSGRWCSTAPWTPASDPITESINQLAGFQKGFDDYAADCAESAGCPLGTDPAQFVTRFHQLVDPLVARPAATSDPRGLSYQDAITGTVSALYSPRYWTYLTSGLLGLQRGTDPVDLLLLADDYQQRDEAGHYKNQQDAFNAIRCVDAVYPTDPAVWADADRRSREVGAVPVLRARSPVTRRATCARCGRCRRRRWPAPPRRPGPARWSWCPRRGDPATPYQAGVEPGPADGRAADHLRRHPAHRGVQRRRRASTPPSSISSSTRSYPPAGLRC